MTNPAEAFTAPLSPQAQASIKLGECIMALRLAACEALSNGSKASADFYDNVAEEADKVWKEL